MIFLDVNFIISLFIEDHSHNKQAMEIYERIKDQELIITNSVIMEVMTVLNIKLKVSKDTLEKVYTSINTEIFEIIEDTGLYDDAIKRQIAYLPERLPFFDCLYIELMEQMNIKEIATFDKQFDNKGIIRIE